MNNSAKKITVTGTGDSLFTARFPEEYLSKMRPVADFIQGCDVRLTNLETNFSDFGDFASEYSGGTWLNTPREYAEDLFRFGFDYYGTANNHVMDYSYHGLLSTIDTLESHGKFHSGTGRSLEEAAKPALFTANGCKIAVFAVDTSFENASRAGRATAKIAPRPGVNYLRHETTYYITPEQEKNLREIADQTGINFTRNMSIATGFLPEDQPGFYLFGNTKFTTKKGLPQTSCNTKDKTRLIQAIQKAKSENDLVFMLVHCHDNDSVCESNPPTYLKEFARACIDAGVSAIFGGGCHSLRPIEIYNNAPIFYSLGDFIYQGLTVEYLPADFMEKFNADINLPAYEALMVRARGGKVGLHCHKKNYQTVLPKIEFTEGKMTGISLLPLYLNFDRKDKMNGLPVIAEGNEATEILDKLNELSKPYGIQLALATNNKKIFPLFSLKER